MAIPGGELKADTLKTPAAEIAADPREPSTGIERILEADEIAAELVFDAPEPPRPLTPPTSRPAPPPRAASTHRPLSGSATTKPQPSAAAFRHATNHLPAARPQPSASVAEARRATSGTLPARTQPSTADARHATSHLPAPRTQPLSSEAEVRRTTSGPPPARTQPSTASVRARLESAEAELIRLRTQMRARDAYLAELERALDASTNKLEASGIGSLEDAHKLLGRVRGQAFRIAELESELRNMEQRLSRLSRLLPAGYTA